MASQSRDYWPPNRLCWTLTNAKAHFTCHQAEGGHPGQQNYSSLLTSNSQALQQNEYGRWGRHLSDPKLLKPFVQWYMVGEQPPCVPVSPNCCLQPALFISTTRTGTEFGELDNVTSKKQGVYKTREHGEGLFLDQNLTKRELTSESNVLTRLEREGLAQTRCKEADSGLGLSGKPHLL